uniref:RNase H type-1 domain-containing protein n=1 Tax=Chenopodium quinoa TaxID=63459 RepID=A0A803N827_CHEQI
MHLSQFELTYVPQKAVKGQALVDFLDDHPPMENVMVQAMKPWTMFFDGSSRRELAGAGIVINSPSSVVTNIVITFSTQYTNNRAEFEALVIGLWTQKDMGVTRVKVLGDLQWMIAKVNKEYKGISLLVMTFSSIVQEFINAFEYIQVSQIPREENRKDAFFGIISSAA